MLTVAVCACAGAVANGQVSVPSVKLPPVNAPSLESLPQVPSAPSVSAPGLPKAPAVKLPSAPATPSLPQVPSVRVPAPGDAPGGPSVRLPSTRSAGGGGSSGAPPDSAPGAEAAGTGSPAATTASRRPGRGARPLTPKQSAARHERRLRRAARRLVGCLPALPSFERDVIVLRGGLHGRRPLSRAKTAERLGVGAGRVRAAERRGLAGLRKADAKQGCGLRTAAGRDVTARRLADGSVRSLEPLPVAAPSPALLSTGKLGGGRGKVLAGHASSGRGAAGKEPRQAGFAPTSNEGGSGSSAALWAIMPALLLMGALAVLLLRRRRNATPWSPEVEALVNPFEWNPAERAAPPPVPALEPEDEPAHEPAAHAPLEATPTRPRARRRDRAVQTLGGLAASGAAITLLLGRMAGRRRRRR